MTTTVPPSTLPLCRAGPLGERVANRLTPPAGLARRHHDREPIAQQAVFERRHTLGIGGPVSISR